MREVRIEIIYFDPSIKKIEIASITIFYIKTYSPEKEFVDFKADFIAS